MILISKLMRKLIDAINAGERELIKSSFSELKKIAFESNSIKAIEMHEILINKVKRTGLSTNEIEIKDGDYKYFIDRDPSNYTLLLIYAKYLINNGSWDKGVHLLRRIASSGYRDKETALKLLKDFEIK